MTPGLFGKMVIGFSRAVQKKMEINFFIIYRICPNKHPEGVGAYLSQYFLQESNPKTP